jgi:predicted Rossmann fold flavoprotein
MLLRESEKAKIKILTDCSVKNLNKNVLFEIETNHGSFQSESVVIATGGASFPKIGATGFGYEAAKKFGLEIVEIRPSLVPLIFAGDNAGSFQKLAGVSIETVASVGKISFRENILFTHRGLSGPAVLQISNYWKPDKPVTFDLLPDSDALELLMRNDSSKQNLDNFLSRRLPHRFAEIFTARNFSNKPVNQLSRNEIAKIAEKLNCWQMKFSETEGFHKAEVTLGGVSTDEISSQTMEAKKVSGLYFIGEVVDVTGWLGGYNFQWAWASGFAAGQTV